MAEDGESTEKTSMAVKAGAAVFATVVAPVLLALGMKLVDKVGAPAPAPDKPASKEASPAPAAAAVQPVAAASVPQPVAAVQPVNAAQPSAGAVPPAAGSTSNSTTIPSASSSTFKEIPLNSDWTFHPLEAGSIDQNRFVFRPDGSFSVSATGPQGILLRSGEYDDFNLTVTWRFHAVEKSTGQLESGILVRSGLDHWPDNRLEVALAGGKIGKFRPGNNVAITAVESGDKTRPRVDWHTIEIQCQADKVTVKNDGTVINTGTGLSRKSGRIGLMVETRDIEFRDFRLERLTASSVVQSSPQPAAQSASQSPIGTWEIRGTDSSSKTKWVGRFTLTTRKNGNLTGYIDWTGTGGQFAGASGREHVSVTYDKATRVLKVKGDRIENGNKLYASTYTVQISEDGTRMTWNDDKTPDNWQGKRVADTANP